MPDPDVSEIFDHVYAEPHPGAGRERAEFVAYQDSFDEEATDEPDARSPRRITRGLRKAMEKDPKVVLMGEDIGKLGGVFRVTEGLQKDFGEDRVIDTPLAESGIMGTAIGLALRGYRPVVEIQFDGFVYPAFDQIVTQLAKLHARSRGSVSLPIVVRIPFGGGIGAVEHHSETNEAYFAHTAGLQVVVCSNPEDAYWMIQQADRVRRPGDLLRAQAPLLGEGRGRRRAPRRRSHRPGPARGHRRHPARLRPDGPDLPRRPPRPPRRRARRSRSSTCARCRPLDMAPSSARSGRPAAPSSSTRRRRSSASAPRSRPPVTERCFYSLEAPVLRVGGFNTPYPPSRIEEDYLPDLDRVLDAVDRSLAH